MSVPTVPKSLRLRPEHALAIETLTAMIVEHGKARLPGSVLVHLSSERVVSESEVTGACAAAILHLVSEAPHRSLDERARVVALVQARIAAWDCSGPPSPEMPPEVATVLRALLAEIEGTPR